MRYPKPDDNVFIKMAFYFNVTEVHKFDYYPLTEDIALEIMPRCPGCPGCPLRMSCWISRMSWMSWMSGWMCAK